MRYFFITLALICTSCTSWFPGSNGCKDTELCDPPIDPSIKEIYYAISRTIFWYVDPLPLELGIYLRHSYVYRDEGGGLIIWMDFHSQNLLDVDEARRIMVETVEGFLSRLNVNPEVLKLCNGLPFTFNNLYVSIEYESYFGQFVDPLYVGRTELKEGFFTASYAHTSFNERAPIFHKHEEPYESSRFFIQVEDDIENSRMLRALEEEANKGDPLNWKPHSSTGVQRPFGTGASRQPPPEPFRKPPLNPALLRRPVPSVVTPPATKETYIKHTQIIHPTVTPVRMRGPSQPTTTTPLIQ